MFPVLSYCEQSLEGFDLHQGDRLSVFAAINATVPLDGPFQPARQIQTRPPAEAHRDLACIEPEYRRLVRRRFVRGLAPCTRAPQVGHHGRDPKHGPRVFLGRAEVPCFIETLGRVTETLGQKEIPAQRLQNVLPWTNRGWTT